MDSSTPGMLKEGDLVVLEDRTFNSSGHLIWKPRAYGMVFKIDLDRQLFWAFWSDEGRDHQEEPCSTMIVVEEHDGLGENLTYRYRKFS